MRHFHKKNEQNIFVEGAKTLLQTARYISGYRGWLYVWLHNGKLDYANHQRKSRCFVDIIKREDYFWKQFKNGRVCVAVCVCVMRVWEEETGKKMLNWTKPEKLGYYMPSPIRVRTKCSAIKPRPLNIAAVIFFVHFFPFFVYQPRKKENMYIFI